MSEVQGILRPGRDDATLLANVARALQAHAGADASAYSVQEANELITALNSRPVLRWFALLVVRRELAGAGLAGKIDWEAIGDFLIKIAPIIFEIIKMFL